MTTVVFGLVVSCAALAGSDSGRWWDHAVAASLDRAPERKAPWESMLREVPEARRPGLAYLVKHLPLGDLQRLAPDALARNAELAYEARASVPWGAGLPEEVFLDAVLPHASLTETRESMRAEFLAKYLPLVSGCKTPGEAALRVNKTLFPDYKVVYNTKRLEPVQSSRESIAQGMATCTGLSIMLVEACRAVGVPARVAGIASWPGRGGNHTWVEIWDGGWHFVGAAEPDPKGLDHAWFVGDASKAVADQPRNAIWAVTYRATGNAFPSAWRRGGGVPAENVTARYTASRAAAPVGPRLLVEARRGGERVEAEVVALERVGASSRLSGRCLGPNADINLLLSAPATAGESFLVVARHDGRATYRFAEVQGDTVVRLDLDQPPPADSRKALGALLDDRFGTNDARREAARRLLAQVPIDDDVRALAWRAYRESPRHVALRKEFDAKTVSTADRTSPYLWRHVGEKPEGGWGLVIAMHGGGNAPKGVNDSQWNRMFTSYYKEHPEAGGYVYLALRAPNDTWNGFYDDAICPMVERLIRQFVLFGEVNPDRVHALGASHGGYGAFVIGPKMPDRFAAVHASASAPTDGETFGENLRNLRFTFMVGERDTAYGRAERCLAFEKKVQDWRKESGGYPGAFAWLPGVGHSVPDRDKVGEMMAAPPRNPRPDRLVWTQSDAVLTRFYWLETPRSAEGARIEATARANTIALKAETLDKVILWLDQPLIDLSKPITIEAAGATRVVSPKPDLETFCQGLDDRGDPRLAAPLRVEVDLAPARAG